MHIEKAFKAIAEWYEGDAFQVIGITTEIEGDCEDLDQSEHFMSVSGWQSGPGFIGDDYHGEVYFEFEKGKYIHTEFWT